MRKIPNEILMPVLAYYEDFAKTNGRVNEAYPISYTVADTDDERGYIGIEDRNLVDLSKVWRDASEEPEDDFAQILYQDKIGTYRITVKHDIVMLMDNWEDFAAENISRWAYIDDLLPKGGEK